MWKLSLVMLVGCGTTTPELEFQLTVVMIDERATSAVFLDERFPITNAIAVITETFPSYPIAIELGDLPVTFVDAAGEIVQAETIAVGICALRDSDLEPDEVVSEHVVYRANWSLGQFVCRTTSGSIHGAIEY